MIVLLDTAQNLDECSRQLGGIAVEQLFTPLTRRNAQKPDSPFAMDNGAFANFSSKGFLSMLEKHSHRKSLCRWVAVPDVVADARRTLEIFRHWSCDPVLREWPLSFVCQDGQEHLPIPWNKIAGIFIGGTTDWKLSSSAVGCIKAAKALNKWVHIGRVNTPARYEYFKDLGADSCDGTGLARFEDMRFLLHQRMAEPKLFEGGAA